MGAIGVDFGSIADGDALELQALFIDEIFICLIIHKILEECMLILIDYIAALKVNCQSLVYLQYRLTYIHPCCYKQVACKKDSATHSSFLAVHVHLAALGNGLTDLRDGGDEFAEGESAVELEVEVMQFSLGVTLQQLLGELVLIGVLSDVEEKKGRTRSVLCQLR